MRSVRFATLVALTSVSACSATDNNGIGTTKPAGSGGSDAGSETGGSTSTGGRTAGGRTSADGGKSSNGGTAGGAGESGGAGGSSSGGMAASGGAGGSSSGGSSGSGGLGPGGTGGFQGCKGTAYEAERRSADVYVMFDQSSSMSEPLQPPATGTWWTAAQTAFTAFANSSEVAGMGVGLQFFPLGGVAPASCNANYSTPEVPIAPLPGNAAALKASIAAHQPTTFTPTGPALAGALAHMKAWAGTHPGRSPAVILVTDGFPTECEPQQIADIATLAKNAFETSPSVRTHVIGLNLGAGRENLNQIAKAGATNTAIFVNDGASASLITEALVAAALSNHSCEYPLPTPPPNQPLDFGKVNVWITPRSSAARVLPRLDTSGDCQSGDGWLYDNPRTPTRIVLCPATCQTLGASKLEIVLGCATALGR